MSSASLTLPSIRWGLFYGVTLTAARAIGEFGAVLVVSGGVAGRTETATSAPPTNEEIMTEGSRFDCDTGNTT